MTNDIKILKLTLKNAKKYFGCNVCKSYNDVVYAIKEFIILELGYKLGCVINDKIIEDHNANCIFAKCAADYIIKIINQNKELSKFIKLLEISNVSVIYNLIEDTLIFTKKIDLSLAPKTLYNTTILNYLNPFAKKEIVPIDTNYIILD